MTKLLIYQVDAFASKLFTGNPAAVCYLESWLKDAEMQAIAQENNLSETAFFVKEEKGFRIRWFTPNEEVALCGHATLASAYVVLNYLGYNKDEILFDSLSGPLRVKKGETGLVLDFPALSYKDIPLPADFSKLNLNKPQRVLQSEFDLMLVYDHTDEVSVAMPDLQAVAKLDYRGLILTAPSTESDVYSRCFYPGCDVPEDPVTGSAHCVIAPFWCEKLGKSSITAIQGGKRKGQLVCEMRGDRVFLYGNCHLYMEGTIFLPRVSLKLV